MKWFFYTATHASSLASVQYERFMIIAVFLSEVQGLFNVCSAEGTRRAASFQGKCDKCDGICAFLGESAI